MEPLKVRSAGTSMTGGREEQRLAAVMRIRIQGEK
jgi:hypothetical protein